MKDGEERHWFSVPSSNEQLIFREDGIYAQSLTGIEICVQQLTNECGGYQLRRWCATNRPYPVLFSDLVKIGERIFLALYEAGYEFWCSDYDAVFGWWQQRVLVLNDETGVFRVMTPLESRLMLNEARNRERDRQRARELENAASRALSPKRIRKLAKDAAREKWRSMPAYDSVFSQVYGKSQAALTGIDPAYIVYCAHLVVEYRLGLRVGDETSDAQSATA
jgi:hypothetical protein